MAKKTVEKNTEKTSRRRSPSTRKTQNGKIAFLFRFVDQDHHDLVAKAAKHNGLSMNAWLVNMSLKEARRVVGE